MPDERVKAARPVDQAQEEPDESRVTESLPSTPVQWDTTRLQKAEYESFGDSFLRGFMWVSISAIFFRPAVVLFTWPWFTPSALQEVLFAMGKIAAMYLLPAAILNFRHSRMPGDGSAVMTLVAKINVAFDLGMFLLFAMVSASV